MSVPAYLGHMLWMRFSIRLTLLFLEFLFDDL
jgi:hypothetical protein